MSYPGKIPTRKEQNVAIIHAIIQQFLNNCGIIGIEVDKSGVTIYG
jgi:hypothetical protein